MSNANSNAEAIVEKARSHFNRDWRRPEYPEIISERDHLSEIVKRCETIAGRKYLDIGTGDGYVALELARLNRGISVIGADVAEQGIAAAARKAGEQNLDNVTFLTFGGMVLPFEGDTFHGVVSRYAFHHFPLPELSVREICRVLEPGGFLLISDPKTDLRDTCEFANQFAALRDDGHMRWYREADLVALFENVGLVAIDRFDSAVTFPRPRDDRYDALLARTSKEILDLYEVKVQGNEVHMTVPIANIKFHKRESLG
jgi:SAM-dependent methyltransferase